MRSVYLCLLCILLFNSLLTAQYSGKIVYGQKDGVIQPNSNIFCDSKGRLWVGSNTAGLSLFDGKRWDNLTTKDGLLNNYTNPSFEDKEGGIWINHRNGTSRYINGSFQQYVDPRPLIDSLQDGQKWFPNFSYPQILFYDQKKEIPVTLYQDTSKQFWVYEYNYATQAFDVKGEPFFKEKTLEKYAPLMEYKQIDKTWFYVDWNGDYCIAVVVEAETHLVYRDGSVIRLPARGLFYNLWWMPDGQGGYHLYKKEKDQLLKLQGTEWVLVPPPALRRYGKEDTHMPLSFYHKFSLHAESGIYMYYTLWKIEDSSLEDHFILAEHAPFTNNILNTLLVKGNERIWQETYMIKDKAGTFWYRSGSDMIRLFPDQMIIPTQAQGMPTNTWAVAEAPGGKMWFSSYCSDTNQVGLRSFDGLNLERPSGELASFHSFSEGNLVDQLGNVYFPNNQGSPEIPQSGILKFNEAGAYEMLCQGVRGFFLDRDKQGQLSYVTQRNGLWILPKDKKGLDTADWFKIDATKGLKIEILRTALQDYNGNYWMGGHREGLAVYVPEKDTVYNWLIDLDENNPGVLSMTEDLKGNLWLGTNQGLSFFENRQAIRPDLDFKNNLQKVAVDYIGESVITVCKLYDEHTLIIGNHQGYFLLDLDAWYANPRQLSLYPFTEKNGYEGEAVFTNAVWIDHHQDIWLSGSKGVARYTPSLLPRDTVIPSVTIDRFEVGERIFNNFTKKIKLGALEHTVRIYFSHPVNPLLLDNIRFRYRLSGDKDWSGLVDLNQIDYSHLGAGDYTFEVLAEKNGLRSPPTQIKFRIARVLWQNPWFWLGVIALLIALDSYLRRKEVIILNQKLQVEKNKMLVSQLNREKDKVQMEVILHQLNPHFISNVLQWLQIRLDDREDEEGVGVVSKLSANISAVFKNSRAKKPFHSISDELKLTENYLYIQKRRFKDKLYYKMPDEASMPVLKTVNIPLLMIQIHVENAVEHGIRNKKTPGTVKVSCTEKDDDVVITIEDDGIGRKAAQEIGSKGSGNGTLMLKELETFYNQQNERSIRQSYIDDIFTDEQGNSYGTRLIIQIPKQYDFVTV